MDQKRINGEKRLVMQLRKALPAEFDQVKAFYWDLIDQMKDRSNTVGWKKGIYPSDLFLKESISSGTLYLLDSTDGYIASVILNHSWNEGYDGLPWSIDCKRNDILVPHALAVKPDVQRTGIGKLVVKDIIEIAGSENIITIRLDILGGNTAAEILYTKAGFQYVAAKDMFMKIPAGQNMSCMN